jgi:cytochrome c556
MKISITVSVVSAGMLLALAGCGQPAMQTTKSETLFKPTASLQEIMTSIIDPNADEVWNSVASINTAAGTEDKRPHSDEEWAKVRRHAVTLLEASNLLVIEGRQIAVAGANTSAAPAELSAAEIQKVIDSKRPDFIKHAHELHDAVQQAIAAIDAKNAEQLENVGGAIDKVCEQCHKQFWYPNDKRPTTVTSIAPAIKK